MTEKHFTDANLLGQSIKLLPKGLDAFSVAAVKASKRTIFKLSDDYVDMTFPGGVQYSVPKNVKLGSGTGETHTSVLKVESGQDMANDFDTDAELSATYAGVTASASAQYSYHSSLSTSKYYALISVDHKAFQIDVEPDQLFYQNVDPLFIEDVKRLPDWRRDSDVYMTYMKFFNKWGTHVLLSCSFGARYQLRVEKEATKNETKESFEVMVRAEYNGAASIQGQVDVKSTAEYSQYTSARKCQCLVYGGSSSSAIILSHGPKPDSDEYEHAFESWAKSLDDATYYNLVNARVDSLGNILEQSPIAEHQEIAPKLISALKYVSEMRVVTGTIECIAAGELPNPEYGCYIDGEPGIEPEFLKYVTKNIHCTVEKPAHMSLRLHNYTDDPAFHGDIGKVQVRVTSPIEPAEVHFMKPSPDIGKWSIILDLSPIGPVVKCTDADKVPNRMVRVQDSLCEPGTYGE